METPKVSVVIGTKNRPALLRRAVESVLNQTFTAFELIVVDDGSDEEISAEIAGLDSRIRCVRHERSRGECATRNTGIRMARGRYMAFLDDDDEWLPEKLECQVDALESSPPDVGVAYTGIIARLPDGGTFIQHATAEGDVYETLFGSSGGLPVNNISLLVRKACFDEIGLFDEEMVYGAAWDMHVRLAKQWKFVPIRKPLVVIHRSNTGLSGDPRRVLAGRRHGLEKHWAEISARPKCHSGFRFTLGVSEMTVGNTAQARREFVAAIAAWPFNGRALGYLLLSYQPRIIRDAFVTAWRRRRYRALLQRG